LANFAEILEKARKKAGITPSVAKPKEVKKPPKKAIEPKAIAPERVEAPKVKPVVEKHPVKKPSPKKPPKKGLLAKRGLAAMAEKARKEEMVVKPPEKPSERPPEKPPEKKPPKKKDVRKLASVPMEEREPVETSLIGMDLSVLRKMVEAPDLIPWQKQLIKDIIKQREEEAIERKRARVVAEEVAVEVPSVPPEVEEALKYSDEEFVFAVSRFAKQEPVIQDVLALETLKRGFTPENIKTWYKSGAMGIEDVRELAEAMSEITIPDDVSYLRAIKKDMYKKLDSYYQVIASGERLKKKFEEIDERRRIAEADAPKTPEEMDAKKKELIEMTDEQMKDLVQAARNTDMPGWQRDIVIKEAFDRGLIRARDEKELKAIAAEPIEGVLTKSVVYDDLLTKAGRLDKKKFESFARNWGFDLSKAEHKSIADWIWEYLKKEKKMPAWAEIPKEQRLPIDRIYRAHIREKYNEPIKKLIEHGEYKSVERFAGQMWKEFGKKWMPIPPHELGLVKVAYPKGMSESEWRNAFMSRVMGAPFKAQVKEAQMLYKKYGKKGQMPPLSEFKLAPEIEKSAKSLEEAQEVFAVTQFFREKGSPLTYEDFLSIFDNDEIRAKRFYSEMYDYTESGLEGAIGDAIQDMLETPEGKEKLEAIALTDNRDILAEVLSEKIAESIFKPEVTAYKEFAYNSLLKHIPRTETALEYIDFIDKKTVIKPSEIYETLRFRLEDIRPSIENIEIISGKKKIVERWKKLAEELGRAPTALDLFMRYPDITKVEARTLEEAIKLNQLKETYGTLTPEKIEAKIPQIQNRISEFEPGDDKAVLLNSIYDLERLNDYYRLSTGRDLVDKVMVGTMGEMPFMEAKEFASGKFKIEWVMPEDYDLIKAYIEEKAQVPGHEAFVELFKDPEKAIFLEHLFQKKTQLPLGIELDDTTIVRLAEAKGLTGDDIKEAVLAYRTGRALPLDAITKTKLADEDRYQDSIRLFYEVMTRPLPPKAVERIGEIRALTGSQIDVSQGYRSYLSELERTIKTTEATINRLKRQKATEEAERKKGKHERLKEIGIALAALEEERKDLYATVREVGVEWRTFLRTLPKVDYTKGLAKIIHTDKTKRRCDYLHRCVAVADFKDPMVFKPVVLTLDDIYRFWTAPVEDARKKFVEENGREPYPNEIVEMEPNIGDIKEEEKETGKPVKDHAKKIAVIAFMNYAREKGAYAFEFQMAELAKDFGVTDVPLFALPADTPEGRTAQFKEWLKFGLTKHEVESWNPSVQYDFIGDDWTMCDWSGVPPKKREDIKTKKEGMKDCAVHKAKVIQSTALQFIEPKVLQPIIEEIAEEPVASEKLAELLDLSAKLKEELKKESEKSLKAMELSEDAIERLKELESEKAECEAKIALLAEELEKAGREPAVVARAVPKKRKRIIRKTKVKAEIEKKEKELEKVKAEIEKHFKEAKPGKEKETIKRLMKEIETTEKKMKEAVKSAERERISVRDVCFLKDEWGGIKLSVSEHMASNATRRKENQDRLSAARSAGIVTEITMYENYDKMLREEAEALAGLRDYIKEAEAEDPNAFLCNPIEMKTIRSMSAGQIKIEEEERER